MDEKYLDYMEELKKNSYEQSMLRQKHLLQNYRRRRNRTYIVLAFALLGVLIFVSITFISGDTSVLLKIVGFASALLGLAISLIYYLQSDSGVTSSNNRNVNYQIQIELDELRLELQKLKKKGGVINDNSDINETINNLINNTFTEDFIQKKIEKNFSNNAVRNERYANLFREFDITSLRINEELQRLRKSANINLVIGSLFTTVIILALIYEVFFSEISFASLVDLLAHYIPRISLVIFVEIFAFFFLKLYKSNLQEIKYFNNEKTNVDFKLITLKTALFQEDIEMIKICLSELIKTERNFVLKKDESTVEIEKIKNDAVSSKVYTEILERLVPKK